MWSNWAESAKSSVTQALEKTGDVITKAATNAGKSARTGKDSNAVSTEPTLSSVTDNLSDINDTTTNSKYNQPTIVQIPPKVSQEQQHHQDTTGGTASRIDHNVFLSNLSNGWNNVVETTRASIKHAEDAIQEHRINIQQNMVPVFNQFGSSMNYKKRDISLPLDVEALQDAEVVYITDRIITMGHPASMLLLFS